MLFRYALRQQSVSWLLWAVVSVGAAGAVVGSAPAVNAGTLRALFAGLPAPLRAILGSQLIAQRPLDAFVFAKLLLYVPLLVAIFSALQAASMLAREAAQRRFDFLLALPVSRRAVLLARLGGLVAAQAALWGAILLALGLFVRQRGLPFDWTGYLLAGCSGLAVDLVLGAGALWASAAAADYRSAMRLGLGIAVVPFMFDLAARMAGAGAGWRRILPYGYYDPQRLLLTHAFPWPAAAVLLPASAALAALALVTFERREV